MNPRQTRPLFVGANILRQSQNNKKYIEKTIEMGYYTHTKSRNILGSIYYKIIILSSSNIFFYFLHSNISRLMTKLLFYIK